MLATQHKITHAYQHQQISFNFWAWATVQLEKVERKWDDFLYNEVIKEFDKETKNARNGSRKPNL